MKETHSERHEQVLFFFFCLSSPEPKAYWWAASVVGLSVCRPHSLNISSETTGPFEAKFHVESPWDGGTNVCSNGPGHMTKMATMAIYGKNLKKSSSHEPKGQLPWNLVCSIGCSSTTKFVQMMTLDLDLFYSKAKFGPLCFCMGKRKNNGLFRNYCRLWFEISNR